MRKITCLLLLALSTAAFSQNYNFVKTNAPYVELVNPTSLSNGEIWDDPEYELSLPFSFLVNNLAYSNLFVFDSYLAFGVEDPIAQIVTPFGNDLIDRGSNSGTSFSPISYKIDGAIGNRIVKIQYKNCGSFSDDSLSMFVNFQIWLYEGSNIIEYRYGASSVTNPAVFYSDEIGGIIGILGIDPMDGSEQFGIYLIGVASNPTTTGALDFITGTPANTTVYRFTPTNLSAPTFDSKKLQLFPNPTTDYLKISNIESSTNYSIQDISGKIISSGIVSVSQNTINADALQVGLYFLNVDGFQPQKFMKK